jgi:hypothetical protein
VVSIRISRQMLDCIVNYTTFPYFHLLFYLVSHHLSVIRRNTLFVIVTLVQQQIKQGSRENYIMRTLMICTIHPILFV